MGKEPLGKKRRQGGRPREVDEDALRGRYGQPGVDLATQLYALAEEAGFSNISAAQRWAETDPEDARKYGVFKDSGIQSRRLSETVRMVYGPIPTKLVLAYFALWDEAPSTGASSARKQSVKKQLAALRRKVVEAHDRSSTSPARSRAAGAAAKVEKLRDELLQVQHDLIHIQQSESRFRSLSSVLFIALTQLQGTHHRLVQERDELRARAESSAAVEADARVAGEQLARAQRQLDEARARTAEAEELAEDLRIRYTELYARLLESGAADTSSTTASTAASETFETGATLGGGSLAEAGATLDRVEYMLAEGVLDLAQTRDRLDQDDTNDEQEVIWPISEPDIPLNRPYRPEKTLYHPDNPPNSSTRDVAREPGSQAGWTTWPGPPARADLTENPPQPANDQTAPADVQAGDPPSMTQLIQSARLDKPFRVAVVSLKGGVGRTTIALCLGELFAELRAEPVIAMDTAPYGNLAQRLSWEIQGPLQHLTQYTRWIASHDQARMYTSRSVSGLEVLASTDYTARDYRDTLQLLERFYGIVITDCAPGLTRPAMPAVLEQADALLVVASCSADAAQTSADTLKWLAKLGYGPLPKHAIVVLNHIGNTAGRLDIDELKSYFVSSGYTVVTVPDDPHLADGTAIEPGKLAAATRTALLDLAAHLTNLFPAAHGMHAAKNVTAPVIGATQSTPVDKDTYSAIPIAPKKRSWQDELRLLDNQLASGKISADEYRYRRDAALSGNPIDTDTYSAIPIAPKKKSWQEELVIIDGQLASGKISAHEYRYRRDAILRDSSKPR